MKQTLIGVLVLVVLGALVWFFMAKPAVAPVTGTTASSTVPLQTVTTQSGLTFRYNFDYTLATSSEQANSHSPVPTCSSSTDYCFYRVGTEYKGTPFESAGLSVKTRTDLTSAQMCVSTWPPYYSDRYTTLTPKVINGSGYSTSAFPETGGVGTGIASYGGVYRLYVNGTCTEFETTITEEDGTGLDPNTFKPLSDADNAAIDAELTAILNNTLVTSTGKGVVFPGPYTQAYNK